MTYKTSIDDYEFTDEDGISSVVTLRENAVDDALIVANNEKGKIYLTTDVHMGAEVVISYQWEDAPSPLNEWIEVFRGKVVELNPSLTISGAVVSVRAYGKAICLKDMRVATEYGTESVNRIKNLVTFNEAYHVDGFTNNFSQWERVGVSPWLIYGGGDGDYIWLGADPMNIPKKDGFYTFDNLITKPEVINLTTFQLWFRCRLVAGTGGQANSVKFIPSVHDGSGWRDFDEVSVNSNVWTYYTVDLLNALNIDNFNDFKMYITLSEVNGGGSTKGQIQISEAFLVIIGSGYDEITTLRDILTDVDIGIIPNFVEKMQWTANGTPISSGYSLDTTYVYNDQSEFQYLYFPYVSAFDCLKDIINLLSAMNYPNAGPHWIITPDGKLCIAPIGKHQVNGIPESIWADYARVTPLIVTQHNIIEDFVQEEPVANTVMVVGNFTRPMNELWTEGHKDQWQVRNCLGIYDDTTTKRVGEMSLRVQGSPVNAPLWTTIYRSLVLNVNSIGSEKNVPSIKFFGSCCMADDVQLICGTGLYQNNDLVDDYFSISVFTELGDGGSGLWSDLIERKLGSFKESDDWDETGSPDWSNINYIGFRIHKPETILFTSTYFGLDGFEINGTVIRCAYDSSNIAIYGAKIACFKDSLASTDSLDAIVDTGSLAIEARSELIRAKHPLLHGRIMIELDPRIKAGQLIHVHVGETNTPDVFQIDQDFRIVEVQHSFTISGALTTLTLVDDLLNSISIGPSDAYTSTIRAVDPDAQTKTMASLRSTKEFDPDLVVLSKDYGGT